MTPYKLHEADLSSATTRRQIEALFRLTFPGRGMIPFDGHWWLVRDAADLPAAFAAWCPSPHVPGAAYMSRAGVLPAHRGNGLHPWLLDVRERHATAAGFRVLVSNCNADNVQSANNFADAGYRLFLPTVLWDGEGRLYWRKSIAP